MLARKVGFVCRGCEIIKARCGRQRWPLTQSDHPQHLRGHMYSSSFSSFYSYQESDHPQHQRGHTVILLLIIHILLLLIVVSSAILYMQRIFVAEIFTHLTPQGQCNSDQEVLKLRNQKYFSFSVICISLDCSNVCALCHLDSVVDATEETL